MSRAPLFAVVALSGAAVLTLEILGTRVLGPFYGVSLYLWSALISTTLAALAVGYWLGGRWADRGPRGGRLALVLLGAGLWTVAIPWLRVPVLALGEGHGLRTAVLLGAGALFFPPLALLGIVGPYAIRLGARSVDEVGRTAGDLFAVSTLASVAAALLSGFVLVPALGVTRLLWAVGATLFLAAALARGLGGARGPGGAAGASLALVACLGLAAAAAAPAVSPTLAAHVSPARLPASVKLACETPYGALRVVDHAGLRMLLLDGAVHTAVTTDDYAPRQEYVPVAELGTEWVDRRGRALIVGLGGGALARALAFQGWKVDAVEIDPVVTRVAHEDFHLYPAQAVVYDDDGRRFLRRTHETYDLIVLDAFGSGGIPFHLVTREAFAEARAHLARDGALVLNVESIGWQEPLVKALGATLATQFADVLALPIAEPPDQAGNMVLVAADHVPDILPARLGDPVATLPDDQEHWRVLQRMHAWNNRFTPTGGRVLTDDWNPSDLRAEEINFRMRKETRAHLPASVQGW
jgi:spermidine synthase